MTDLKGGGKEKKKGELGNPPETLSVLIINHLSCFSLLVSDQCAGWWQQGWNERSSIVQNSSLCAVHEFWQWKYKNNHSNAE